MRGSRTHNVVSILIWIFIGTLASYVLYSAIQNGGLSFEPKYQGEPTTILSDVTLDASIDNVAIDWITGGVKIIPTTGNKIRIVEKAYKDIDDGKLVKISVNGSDLQLTSRNKTVIYFFGLTTSPTFLEVYLPISTSFEKVKLNGISGDYQIDDIYADLTQITLTSGNLTLNNSFSTLLSLKMTSGDATIRNSEFLTSTFDMTSGSLDYASKCNDFTGKMTSGDVDLEFMDHIPTSLTLTMTSGNIAITLPESNPFRFAVNKTTGSFTPHYEVTKTGETYAYKTGGPLYSIKMTSGTIDVDLSSN